MNEKEQERIHEELRKIGRMLDALLELQGTELDKFTTGLREVNDKLDQLQGNDTLDHGTSCCPLRSRAPER